MPFAWLGAVLIGVTLGLLGSGGSILTVPILKYLAGEPDKIAIAESLAIVGTIALFGAVPYAKARLVDARSVLFFGVPGLAGTYAGAVLAAQVPGPVQLVLFAVLMLAAAWRMLRGAPTPAADGDASRLSRGMLAALGAGVGVVTGLVGVGGGFLIVPALVLVAGLPMRRAVGTSLVVIALNSAVGVAKHAATLHAQGLALHVPLILGFAVLGIAGAWTGQRFGQKVPQATLRKGFAVFLVAMGAFILWREVPGVLASPPAVAVSLR